MKIKLLLGISLLSTFLLRSQTTISTTYSDRVDQKINAFLEQWNIPGAGVAITKNGKLIYNKGLGFINQEKTEPARANTLFRIASVSKPITSIAIMKLIQEGKLSLNDSVFGKGKILDQPYYLDVISDKRIYAITIQNLLEHTAGWDRNIPTDGFSHNDPPFFPQHVAAVMGEANPVGDSTLIKFSLKKGLNHYPSSTYSYSNIGYLVLGKVIEKLTGMKYEEYVQKAIFYPLNIKDIHLGKNLPANAYEGEAEYCSNATTRSCYGDGKKVPWQYGGFNLEAMNAHGGWIASAADLTRLILAIDGFDTSPDILNPVTLALMRGGSNANPRYAKGWSVNGSNYWHTGSLDGTASFVCRTADGYTWALLLNGRADNSEAFWRAFDRLPWECLNSFSEISAVDLFKPAAAVAEIKAGSKVTP
jgi:CubicO group peptidase (beta-lactamase class C family)